MQFCHDLAHLSDQLKIIGVTGANGKTTTSCLIAGVLAHAGHKVGLISSLGYFDGEDVEDAAQDLLPPERLAALLSRMIQNGCSYAVMAISQDALAQSHLSGLWFDAACITNATRDHLTNPHKIQDYRLPKMRIFDRLHGEAFVVLNADDPLSEGYLHQLNGPALTVGMHSPAEITATLLEQFPSEQTFLITAGADTVTVQTRMIGTHHIYNCLLATAVGLAYNVELPQIARTLEAAKHIPGRLERIECGQPFSVFIDTAATPNALAGSLHTLRTVTQGKLICMFGVGIKAENTNHRLLGQMLEQNADLSIVTGDNSSSKNQRAIIEKVLSGCERPKRVQVVPDRCVAIHRALSLARQGDCVLIAGKGNDSYPLINDQSCAVDDADDRQIAREWLYEVQPFAI